MTVILPGPYNFALYSRKLYFTILSMALFGSLVLGGGGWALRSNQSFQHLILMEIFRVKKYKYIPG